MRPLPDSYSAVAEIRRHWAVFLGIVISLAIWCGVDVARRAIIDANCPELHMTDFTVYTGAGAAFFNGGEPYEVTNVRGWHYLYPPLFALLVAPLSLLESHWQATVWFALSSLMAFGCYFECRRLIGPDACQDNCTSHELIQNRWRKFSIRHFATALGATLLPALNTLQRGQMGLALLYPLLLGFRMSTRGDSRAVRLLGGILLALPIAFKLTPALPVSCVLAILFVVTLKQRGDADRVIGPAVGLIIGCLLFFLVVPAALIGWNNNIGYLRTWYERVASHVNDVRGDDFGGDVASLRNQSLDNAVFRCGNWAAHKFWGGPDDLNMDVTKASMPMDSPAVIRLLSVFRILALAVLLVAVVTAGMSGKMLLHGVAIGLACVATLVVSPVSRGHYFVFWLPAVLFVPLWLREIGRPRHAAAAAVIPAALTIAHYGLLDYTGRVGLLGLGTAAWYFAVCWQVWAWRDKAWSEAAEQAADSRFCDPLARAA